MAEAEGTTSRRLRAVLGSCRGRIAHEIGRSRYRLVPNRAVLDLHEYRKSPEYMAVFESPRPLVSVTISTYNRAEILVGRSLASVLSQDYDNLEVIVVDDGSVDDTERRVRELADPRIRFVRMTHHLLPPTLGAGIEARNFALALASGVFVTHLDDDDEYVPDRIAKLVRFAQQERAEFVWHPFWWQETPDQAWAVNAALRMAFGRVTTGSVFYIGWLKRFQWPLRSVLSYSSDPDDWMLFRMLRDMGVVMKRHPDALLRHHKEGENPRWVEQSARSRK